MKVLQFDFEPLSAVLVDSVSLPLAHGQTAAVTAG